MAPHEIERLGAVGLKRDRRRGQVMGFHRQGQMPELLRRHRDLDRALTERAHRFGDMTDAVVNGGAERVRRHRGRDGVGRRAGMACALGRAGRERRRLQGCDALSAGIGLCRLPAALRVRARIIGVAVGITGRLRISRGRCGDIRDAGRSVFGAVSGCSGE